MCKYMNIGAWRSQSINSSKVNYQKCLKRD